MSNRTIVAIGGGGFGRDPYDPRLDDYLLSLVDSDRPRVSFLPQASAECKDYVARFFHAYARRADASWVSLFDRRVLDLRAELLGQDMIFVGGGNTANMLAIWRVHGVDEILREAWESGIVLCGVSAGAICWFESSVTDSFGLQLDALPDGLSFLPGSFCPHYDGEERRRPVYRELISSGRLPPGVAADDCVAVRYAGRDLAEVVSTSPTASAWRLERNANTGYDEEPIEPRRLRA
jgi:peptidase E